MTEQSPLAKIIDMTLLADFYGPLLTEKQRQAIALFYEEDFSLTEIAEACACTRQAAHDLIKRSELLLLDYEQKLALVARHRHRQQLLAQAERQLAALGISDTDYFWKIWQEIKE